jgi:hypothetical protein
VIASLYLLAVVVSVVALAVALRRRPAPVPPTPPETPAPTAPALVPGTEIRVILAAAAQLAARLDTAA